MAIQVPTILDEVAAHVERQDFPSVCATMGQFAQTQAAQLGRVEHDVALLAQHSSGLTLMYLRTNQFAPRRHGTWCVVAPLQRPIEVQGWTEFIPPANSTGDGVSSSFPDICHRCDVGEGLHVPQSQLFSLSTDHHLDVLLLFGAHPNMTWPESRLYSGSHHTERTLRYPETLVEL